MKRQLAWMISGACAAALIGVTATTAGAADVVEKSASSSSTTTTTYRGTVSEIAPSTSTIILKSESAPEPVRYNYTEKTVFVDPAGKVVSREEIRGKPVTVEYTKEGDRTVVTKVIVSQPDGGVVQKRETTTETIH